MTREIVLQRMQNGETVTTEDVATLRNIEGLNALKMEAVKRQTEQDAIQQTAEKREALINELVALDKAAESAARYFNDVSERRTKETRKLDELELEARAEWYQAYRTFDAKFREVFKLNPSESYKPEVEARFDELKASGAICKAALENISNLPLSPSLQMLLRESVHNASANIDL